MFCAIRIDNLYKKKKSFLIVFSGTLNETVEKHTHDLFVSNIDWFYTSNFLSRCTNRLQFQPFMGDHVFFFYLFCCLMYIWFVCIILTLFTAVVFSGTVVRSKRKFGTFAVSCFDAVLYYFYTLTNCSYNMYTNCMKVKLPFMRICVYLKWYVHSTIAFLKRFSERKITNIRLIQCVCRIPDNGHKYDMIKDHYFFIY